ncbi:transposase [Candidatus Desantisbacteria bacterium]|nr:transposase [Candidatus Desantisbacteria bacterium]
MEKNKNDRIDSKTIANLLRCNLFPLAYPYPKEMRATRDLLRRRQCYVAIRAEGYTHIQNTFSQQAIPSISSGDVKRKSSRAELSNQFSHPDISISIDCDISTINSMDATISKIEKQVYAQAKHHDQNALTILMTTPGIGEILALTILYEIHTISRFTTVQNFSSYCRVVKCERTSNGKHTESGGSNNKIGNPSLKWAFSEIIIHAQHHSPGIKKYYEKLKSRHGIGKAKSIMAHKFAIAIYLMLKNKEAYDEKRFLSC